MKDKFKRLESKFLPATSESEQKKNHVLEKNTLHYDYTNTGSSKKLQGKTNSQDLNLNSYQKCENLRREKYLLEKNTVLLIYELNRLEFPNSGRP